MINILWYNRERMSAACCNCLNQMLDTYDVRHFAKGQSLPPGGAVIVFHGGNDRFDWCAEELNRWAAGREWVIFISIGDENTDFPYVTLRHPNMLLWMQTPKPRKVTAHRYFIEGYPNDCREWLDKAGNIPRIFDFFFAGQVTHARRQSMVEVLRTYSFGPRAMVETSSFGAGLPHDMYYAMMRQAYVVPCPSGPATPDTFRFAETLEAGAIPVLDACAVDGVKGYWEMVLGEGHPFTVVEDWAEFPGVVKEILSGKFRERQREIETWWSQYKGGFLKWLGEDVVKLGGSI